MYLFIYITVHSLKYIIRQSFFDKSASCKRNLFIAVQCVINIISLDSELICITLSLLYNILYQGYKDCALFLLYQFSICFLDQGTKMFPILYYIYNVTALLYIYCRTRDNM